MEMQRRTMRMRGCSNSPNLMDLPIEILIGILSRLPTNSLFRFQCVSKTFSNLVNCPSHAALHLQYTATHEEPPRVMILYRSPSHSRFITLLALKYEMNGNKGLTAIEDGELVLDISSNIGIRYKLELVSCGLLLFIDKSAIGDQFLLFNPLRKEVLKLPAPSQVEAEHKYKCYGIGFDPITSTHKIVCVSGKAYKDSLVTQVHVLGTSSWRSIPSVDPPSCLGVCKGSQCVYAYGNMHWLIELPNSSAPIYRSQILSFDIKKEELSWTPHPKFGFNNMRHLLNLRGCMAVVDASLSSTKIEIWVLKNYDKKEWSKDYSIDFDLGPYYDDYKWWARSSSIGAWEHGIFLRDYAWFFKGVVFFYDLRSGQRCRTQIVDENRINQMGIPLILSYTGSLVSLRNYDNLIDGQRSFSYLPRKYKA